MISYGSFTRIAKKPLKDRSHQLGEGLPIRAEMSYEYRPSQPVYGSQKINAETLCEKRSHQFTEKIRGRAQQCHSRLIFSKGGVRLITQQCHQSFTLPHQFTGAFVTTQQCQSMIAPTYLREPIELRRNANLNYLPPILTRGQSRYAAMPRSDRLLKEGS